MIIGKLSMFVSYTDLSGKDMRKAKKIKVLFGLLIRT